MGQKRGQLTIFIIVGLVVLIGIGTVVYITSRQQAGSLVEERARVEDPTTQLQGIVQECLRSTALPLLRELSANGGTMLPPFITYHGERYSTICNDVPQFGCVNTLRTKRDMAVELDTLLSVAVNNCINLDPLKTKGYAIEEQTPATTSSVIGFEDITVEVKTRIKLRKGEDVITFESIADKIQTPLGKLHSLSHVLLNQYSENGYIDKDSWMKDHGASIGIMIDRPYPDTVLRLNTTDNMGHTYIYRVGMSGIETAKAPLDVRPAQKPLPTCLDNYDCYDNVPESLCELKKGTNTTPGDGRCNPPFVRSDLCNGKPCNDCMAGDVKVTHGQQWCATNGRRKDGLDPAGSRFLKLSCIDGQVMVEPCRDFREEFCTEEGAVAACRLNRWQDCWSQTSETACNNATRRDCFWTGGLVPSPRITFEFSGRNNDRCRPLVGPGFEHWTNSAKLVCRLGNEQVREEIGVFSQAISWKPPVVHSNGQAQFCYSLGDCGNKRNLVDLSQGKRYKSTTGKPAKPLEFTDQKSVIHRPLKVPPFQGVTPLTFSYPQGDQEGFMEPRTREYIAWWLQQDPLAVLMDQVQLWIRHSALCKVFKAPKKKARQHCDDCNIVVGGCSKYLCKSLGANCHFNVNSNGYGSCSYPGDSPPLEVTLSFPGHTASKTSGGYRLNEELNPFEKFNVTIKTNNPAVCAFSMLPSWSGDTDSDDPEAQAAISFVNLASSLIHQDDSSAFTTDFRDPTTEETLVLEAPDLDFIGAFEMTGSSMLWGLANPGGVVKAVSDKAVATMSQDPLLKDRFDSMKGQIGGLTNGFDKMVKSDSKLTSAETKAKYLFTYTDLLPSASGTRVMRLFLTCEDESGEATNDEISLQVPIKKDAMPPHVVNVTPAPPGPLPPLITFKLDEPAQCGYALDADALYDDMVPLTCDTSRLSTRVCTMHPDVSGPHSIFVRCRDRPFAFIYGELAITKGTGLPTTMGGYFQDTIETINYTITPFFRHIQLGVPTQKDSMPLQLNFGVPYVCKWSATNQTWARMPNIMQCENMRCTTTLDTSSEKTYYFICNDDSGPDQNTNMDPFIYEYT